MRYAFWLLVIGFSVSALAGGFLSGRAAVPQFPARARVAPLRGIVPQTDELAQDAFAQDPAVTVASAGGSLQQSARLALTVVDAGHSPVLETPFLRLGIPVTLVVDPSGPAAGAIARAASEAGDAVYLQMHAPLHGALVREIHAAFPQVQGVALRIVDRHAMAPGALAALRRARLGVLDEAGVDDRAESRTREAGVAYAVRGITVDDHAQHSYVSYMLAQAAHLARGRTVVVMARPFPGTLQAVEDLLARAPRDGIHFVALP